MNRSICVLALAAVVGTACVEPVRGEPKSPSAQMPVDGDALEALQRKLADLETLAGEIERLRAATGTAAQVAIEFQAWQVAPTRLADLGLGIAWHGLTRGQGAAGGGSRVLLSSAAHDPQPLLNALAQAGCAKLVAAPTLVATSGRASHFFVGALVPVEGASGNNAAVRRVGTDLTFQPRLLPAGKVQLEMRACLSWLDADGLDAGPSIRATELDTALMLGLDQSLLILTGARARQAVALHGQTRELIASGTCVDAAGKAAAVVPAGTFETIPPGIVSRRESRCPAATAAARACRAGSNCETSDAECPNHQHAQPTAHGRARAAGQCERPCAAAASACGKDTSCPVRAAGAQRHGGTAWPARLAEYIEAHGRSVRQCQAQGVPAAAVAAPDSAVDTADAAFEARRTAEQSAAAPAVLTVAEYVARSSEEGCPAANARSTAPAAGSCQASRPSGTAACAASAVQCRHGETETAAHAAAESLPIEWLYLIRVRTIGPGADEAEQRGAAAAPEDEPSAGRETRRLRFWKR